MAERVSIKQKRRETPAWVFAWKPLGRPVSARLLPVMLVGSLLLLALSALRIQVRPPKPWSADSASLIQVFDNAEGRDLEMRAREGGPFPSRFDVREWARKAGLEQDFLDTAGSETTAYMPKIRLLADRSWVNFPKLAAQGVAMLPKHEPKPEVARSIETLRSTPILRVLSGIRLADVPAELPPFDPVAAARLSSRDWRFYIQLDAAGNVTECVSLSGEDDAALSDWLAEISFPLSTNKSSRWISVEVGFINRQSDGTGNR